MYHTFSLLDFVLDYTCPSEKCQNIRVYTSSDVSGGHVKGILGCRRVLCRQRRYLSSVLTRSGLWCYSVP